jgi:hypothetical protein
MFSSAKSKINLGATGIDCAVVMAVTETLPLRWRQSAGAIFMLAVTKSRRNADGNNVSDKSEMAFAP